MAKSYRQSSSRQATSRVKTLAIAAVSGLGVSILFSIVIAVILSLFSLFTDSNFVEEYLLYIMVAVNTVAIFCGSAYAAHKAKSYGLALGMVIGALYVFFSLAVGVLLNQEIIQILPLVNKLAAALASGALGGLVGVNL
jgi:putative membrane protein (TIGR04086 family)